MTEFINNVVLHVEIYKMRLENIDSNDVKRLPIFKSECGLKF